MADQSMTQYLSFTLGADQYAVEILSVREIRGWEPVRAIPDVPEYVVGLLSFREGVVPVVDLRLRFNVKPVVYESTTVIIVFSYQSAACEQLIAVVVDGVSDVLDVDSRMRHKAPDMGCHIDTRFIEGIVAIDEDVIVLLNIKNFLNPDELMRLESVIDIVGE